jgi:hypothetical protein
MGSFATGFDIYAKNSAAMMDKAARKLVLEVGSRLILRTPVKKGGARGGWQTAIFSSSRSENSRIDPSGQAAIAELQNSTKDWKPTSGVSAFITNLVPYILRLEHGYSRQAPSGMMAVTIAEVGGIDVSNTGGGGI